MSSTVRIQHIATGDTTLQVQRRRADVDDSREPFALVSRDRLRPGQAITLTLHEGEFVVLNEVSRD